MLRGHYIFSIGGQWRPYDLFQGRISYIIFVKKTCKFYVYLYIIHTHIFHSYYQSIYIAVLNKECIGFTCNGVYVFFETFNDI